MSTTYFISAAGDNWTKTKARTLSGAKRVALKAYQQANGGRIEIGVSVSAPGYEMGKSVDCVAYKPGYQAWVDAR